MEKLDKNYIIGLVLMFVMYGTYVAFMPKPPVEIPEEQKVEAVAEQAATPVLDSVALVNKFGDMAAQATGTEEDFVLENNEIKVVLSNKGGSIKEVILKKYKTYDTFLANGNEPITIVDQNNSVMKFEVNKNGTMVDLKSLFASSNGVAKQADGKNGVSFKSDLGNDSFLEQTYTLADSGYVINYDLGITGNSAILNNNHISFTWENKLKKLENNLNENRKAAQINYYDSEDEFDDLGFGSTSNDDDALETPIKWYSFKQKYFTQAFIADNSLLEQPKLTLITPEQDSVVVKDATVAVNIPMESLKNNKGNFKFFFGPNEYSDIKNITEGFGNNVYVGYDVVKPINRYVFIPLFEWFEKMIKNYGILIMIVVFTIKLVLTPLIYKSYSSSAKMRVLAPEIKEIKERVGDDAAKVQQETMKLYQQVGVSPLSGCVPMLLQMPILMSVFFLFPNMIMFRQKSFLWAEDLSTYDNILNWGHSLPIIGDHLSIFVVLYAISSVAFTYYNNQNTPKQEGMPFDISKMAYFFPLIFCVVLNSYAVALTFYYLVSNLVTIGQQLIVRKFIDEDKIKAVLEENKKNYIANPKKKNKFANYLEKQMKASEEMKRESDKLKKNRKKK